MKEENKATMRLVALNLVMLTALIFTIWLTAKVMTIMTAASILLQRLQRRQK